MKTTYKLGFTFSALFCGLFSFAETKIDFEDSKSYKDIGVYDVWIESPFRTGELQGNFAIVPNPDTSLNEITGEIENPSKLVLGAQRSRFGSNRFGVKVDLQKPFELTSKLQYVHVYIHKPQKGRTMLIGLGSRKERLDQNPLTEQFWELSSSNVETDKWVDAVFPIKGADGVEIRSLVIVPDCESPHNLNSDFLFYVDDIEINDDPQSRIINDFYPITGNKIETVLSRNDRSSESISLIADNEIQTVDINQSQNKRLYQDVLDEFFYVKPGQTLIPLIDYKGTWMHAYCYIDLNQDGQFSYDLNEDGTPSGELLSYNYYNGYDSDGTELKSPDLGNNSGKLPSFKLPDYIKPGMYRIRFKLDWNCIDPKGNSANGNNISDNGGVIADAMLCVYSDTVEVNDFQLNGEIVASDGTKLNSLKVNSDEDFAIKSIPEKGFINGGMVIKQGYDLSSENRFDKFGNPHFKEFTISSEEFDSDNIFIIPANIMRANILINGKMIEQNAGIGQTTSKIDETSTLYSINGIKVSNPHSGIYIKSGKKLLFP